MNLKRMYLIALILLVLLSVSAVSAADDSANDVISDSVDEIDLEEVIDDDEINVDVLGENDNIALNAGETGSFTDLNKLINIDYSLNATISLGSDYTYTSSDSYLNHGIYIGRGLTIDGNGHTIDGNHAARIFNVGLNANVKFLNINFINGNATGESFENFGGAIYSSGYNCIAENCNFTYNSAQRDGGALRNVNAYNCNFIGNSASSGGAMVGGSADSCTFTDNSAKDFGGAIFNGSAVGCTFTGNSNIIGNGGAMVGGSAAGCTFIDNFARSGGAINDCSAVGCTFIDNSAMYGGAMDGGSAIDCTFSYNTAFLGGAIYNGSAESCTFISNCADHGGAMDGGSAVDCTFIDNSATYDGGTINEGSAESCTFILIFQSKDQLFYDSSCDEECIFVVAELSASDFSTVALSGEVMPFKLSATVDGEEIIFSGMDVTIVVSQEGETVGTYSAKSALGWAVDLNAGKYNARFSIGGPVEDVTVELNIQKIVSEITPLEDNINLVFGDNSKVEYTLNPEDAVGDITFTSSDPNVVTVDSTGAINAVGVGTATITISFSSDNYFSSEATVTVVVSKKDTQLSANENSVDLFVGDNSKVEYTLNPEDAVGDITFTSSDPNVVTVDSTGAINAVGVGTATITISFLSDNYYAPDANVTVTVSKKDTQLSANAKSFKFEDNVKSYSITLKDKNGNVLKNKKVTLKVNGATYTATTNSKGVATFKLSKLTKKGTYTAVISFAGESNYNKISKNAKLTVKAPAWKTVAIGSKDKAMVKKIQRALKKNGFYLRYNGRYLKVDGIFNKYTQMAVKQFQKAKKLKVTGKVDYATAKKLKLI